MGMTFQAFKVVLRGSNSVHDLISYIYWRQSDTVYCSRKGGRQRGKGWSKSFFLENKVVINFNFRHGAKKSGQSGHSFRSYGFFQWKSKMKEFTNVTIPVTSSAIHVNFLVPSWISWPGAWFERLPDISGHHFHPERVVSFKEMAERGWKSGAR